MTPRLPRTTPLLHKLRCSTAARGAARGLRSFRRDDEGVLAFPVIMCFLLMLAVGGIGMDFIRYERDRAVLQYTLDRAVLAAADLDQPLDPKAVVQDYLTKADLGELYDEDKVIPLVTPSSRSVSARIDTDFSIYWLKFFNLKDPVDSYDATIPLTAASTAVESIGNVEISLVLDISGSMRDNNRLKNLKSAAKEFVKTMDDNTEEGNMSISIIPYSTQVSMPEALITQLNVDTTNPYSFCLNFESSDFNTTELSMTKEYERTMHFNRWGRWDYRSYGRLVDSPECAAHENDPNRTALLLEDDVTKLQNYIDGFSPTDATSVDIGMKWGVAMVDPSVQPMIEKMTQASSPQIDPQFSNRPVGYDDHDTLKVVVLMTDGINTDQAIINPDFRTGGSGIWYNAEENVYSTLDDKGTSNTADDEYYWSHTKVKQDHIYGEGTEYVCVDQNWWGCDKFDYLDEPGEAVELSFSELYARTQIEYIYRYDYLYPRHSGPNYWDIYNLTGTNTKDARTRSICQAAKDQGIVVFTIGFEAPWSAKQVLQDCATSTNHYYDVRGLEIKEAFASIASAIRQLRLTE